MRRQSLGIRRWPPARRPTRWRRYWRGSSGCSRRGANPGRGWKRSRASGSARREGRSRDWLQERALGWFGESQGTQPGAVPAQARDLALAPGMPVELHLRTGERSLLSYLAKPLTDYFARSLRED